MNETTEALKHSDSCYNALRLAEEALSAMLTHMGMDEDEWTKPTFNQARESLAAIREALAESYSETNENCSDLNMKQEPVAIVEVTYGREPECYVTGNIDDFPEGVFKLYAAPVSCATSCHDTKAIGDALLFLVKRCNEQGFYSPIKQPIVQTALAAIRGLK